MSIVVRSNEKPEATTPATNEGETASSLKESATSAPAEKLEQNEAEDSETSEKAEALGSEESEESGEEADSKEETDKQETPKKKGGFQRRIDKLNAAKSAAQQEAEYWKRLALEKAATESKTEAKADPKLAATDKPKPDDFESHAEYVEALTDWKVDQKEKAREEKLEKSKLEADQKKLVSTYSERVKAFSEATPDFNDVISEVDGVALSPAVRDIILSSENGPELAYELAKNPEEYARVCGLSPILASREMGKLEARLASKAPAATDQKSEPKKITKAPKPLAPVSAGKGSAVKSIDDPNLSQSDYEKLRREQQKRRQA